MDEKVRREALFRFRRFWFSIITLDGKDSKYETEIIAAFDRERTRGALSPATISATIQSYLIKHTDASIRLMDGAGDGDGNAWLCLD